MSDSSATSDKFLAALAANETDYADRLRSELENNNLMKAMKNNLHEASSSSNFIVDLKKLIGDIIITQCGMLANWAKHMPRFGELSFKDRTRSIELNFPDTIVIEFVWQSILKRQQQRQQESNSESIPFLLALTQDLCLDKTSCKYLQLSEFYDRLMYIVELLISMGLTKEEYLCLKVIIIELFFLFNFNFKSLFKIQKKGIVIVQEWLWV